MNHLNTVLIEGNLTKDPRWFGQNSQNPGCKFTIANNRYRLKNGLWDKETTFFPVVVFGRLADTCADTLRRGRGVRVCGRLKQDMTKNKDGYTVTDTTFILAEHVEFQPEKTVQKDPVQQAPKVIVPEVKATEVKAPAASAPVVSTTEPPAQEASDSEVSTPEASAWDSSVPENSPTEDATSLDNVGTQISAEEISEVKKSETDFAEAEDSDGQLPSEEPF